MSKTALATVVGSALTPAGLWTRRLTEAWTEMAEAVRERTLKIGIMLLEAKADLPHGEFFKMVESELPFGTSAANKLMAVAANPVLANPEHVPHLPPSWGTLYELSRIPAEKLEKAIKSGKVHAGLERHEVVDVAREVGAPVAVKISPFDCPACAARVEAIDWGNEPQDGYFKTAVYECQGECKKLWLTGTRVIGEATKRTTLSKRAS